MEPAAKLLKQQSGFRSEISRLAPSNKASCNHSLLCLILHKFFTYIARNPHKQRSNNVQDSGAEWLEEQSRQHLELCSLPAGLQRPPLFQTQTGFNMCRHGPQCSEKMLKQKLAQFDLPDITFTQFSLVSVLCIVFAGLSHSISPDSFKLYSPPCSNGSMQWGGFPPLLKYRLQAPCSAPTFIPSHQIQLLTEQLMKKSSPLTLHHSLNFD